MTTWATANLEQPEGTEPSDPQDYSKVHIHVVETGNRKEAIYCVSEHGGNDEGATLPK